MGTPYDAVPGVGRPARDALSAAGYPDLESLDGADYGQLLSLHGVGKRGLERLQSALVDRGMGMHGAPAAEERSAQFTSGHTGVSSEDIKTHPTPEPVEEFIAGLETPRRVEHGRWLLEMFNQVTGERPVMW